MVRVFDFAPNEIVQNYSSQVIIEGVMWGLAPFKPTVVTLYLDQDYRRLHVSVSNLQSIPECVINLDNSGLDVVGYPVDFYNQLAAEVGMYYRDIPYINPPDNVMLGDN
jgi:hypothetical protein